MKHRARRGGPMSHDHGGSKRLGTRELKRAARGRIKTFALAIACVIAAAQTLSLVAWDSTQAGSATPRPSKNPVQGFDRVILDNITASTNEGRQIFRFDTFGDEAFWGDQLQLHRAIEGAKFGGVGSGLTPKAALALGLKVDVDALPGSLFGALTSGNANLDDPATTLALLKANAVVGVSGFFNSDGSLKSVGIQCALCHSTVDNSLAFGIGHRLDGWANRDLDVGKIVALAPNLQPFVT